MIAEKMQTLSHFPPEALELCLCGPDVGAQLRGPETNVAAFANAEEAQTRTQVCGETYEQPAAQADVVVHQAADGSGNQPATLNARQQKRVGLNELALWGQFLNQGGDGGPEHPKTGGDKRVH